MITHRTPYHMEVSHENNMPSLLATEAIILLFIGQTLLVYHQVGGLARRMGQTLLPYASVSL